MNKEINRLLNDYCDLRDRQFAIFDRCARKHNLTANELFVLDILWFASNGCTQKYICKRLSINKQTIAAIASRFKEKGYIQFVDMPEDRRNKLLYLTELGRKYTSTIIPAAAKAENDAMLKLDLANATELVRLTKIFTENMEIEFAKLDDEYY